MKVPYHTSVPPVEEQRRKILASIHGSTLMDYMGDAYRGAQRFLSDETYQPIRSRIKMGAAILAGMAMMANMGPSLYRAAKYGPNYDALVAQDVLDINNGPRVTITVDQKMFPTELDVRAALLDATRAEVEAAFGGRCDDRHLRAMHGAFVDEDFNGKRIIRNFRDLNQDGIPGKMHIE